MKTINVTFTQQEYEELSVRKGPNTWRDFILRRAGVSQEDDEGQQDKKTCGVCHPNYTVFCSKEPGHDGMHKNDTSSMVIEW